MNRTSIAFILFLLLVTGCRPDPIPRPRGYFRIDLPEKGYLLYEDQCPFSLEVPAYAQIEKREDLPSDSCWFNLGFPDQRARIHFTYYPLHNNLNKYLEDSYTFAFKHEMKANAIQKEPIAIPEHQVYGLMYNLKGNVASSLQFYVSDSTHHFLRGALYFDNVPNADSIAPVLEFLRTDIDHLLNTLSWKHDE